MKKLKIIAIYSLFTAISIISTACGSLLEDTENIEEVKLESGENHSTHLINSIKSGKIAIDKTGPEDLIKFFKIDDKGNEYLYDEIKFKGYKLARSFKLYDGVIGDINYETFYVEKNDIDGANAEKNILSFLIDKFGKPDNYGDSYNEWEETAYKITFNIFDDGYSLLISTHLEHDNRF